MIKINAALPVASPLAIEPASDPRQQDLERALAGQLGKTMRGDVLAKMNDGSYLVKVAGAATRMMLPPSTPVGVPVSLHLVAL
ncbi:MAG TPA: flagellar hook-length control protein FliK, partial [Telluria sp.]|nr:flagellar hook-length control protein FliK [Telluria sp.]